MRATQLNTAVFAFGRFNPPTIGHGRLVEVVKKQPGTPFLFLTHTQKPKTDPLTFEQKVNQFYEFALKNIEDTQNLQLLCRRCNYNKNPRPVKAELLDNCKNVACPY